MASMPDAAGSGSGSEGWQMLFRSPDRPELPSEQNPNRPPMSPIPGTEQIPLWTAGCRAAAVTAVTGRLPARLGADDGAADTADTAGTADAGCPACGVPGATASTASINTGRCGECSPPR